MDHHRTSSTDNQTETTLDEAVLCRINDDQTLAAAIDSPETLEQIGFTGVVIPASVEANLAPFEERGITVFREGEFDAELEFSAFTSPRAVSAAEFWTQLEQYPETSKGVDLVTQGRGHEAATLTQLSIPMLPIVPVDARILYSSALREQRELLRSIVFWRKRYGVARHSPKLIHAGDDGLLIFSVDFWLMAINQNPDEASIDMGSYGSMWLMLGTHRDVHLHGSLLILPPYSAAVVANELAR